MDATLTPAVADRLAKLLARLASDHDGERAAAALLATKLLCEHRWAWHDLAAPRPPPPATRGWAAAPCGGAPEVIASLWRRQRLLNDWERSFVRSLREEWRGPLTERQREKLRDIERRLRDAERRPSCAA